MTRNLEDAKVTEKRTDTLKEHITLAGLLAAWVFIFHPYVFSPWISGFDSVTRLAHIDATIVVLRGNPWLPALQVLMQAVHYFADNPIAYKAVNCVVALAGMSFFFLTVLKLFGYVPAVLSFLFFFASIHWRWVSTSVYMEPLALLGLSAAAYFSIRKRPAVATAFFILATFTRPEVLLAAPVLLGMHLAYFKDWRRTAGASLSFLPITVYYVWLKLNLADFSAPLHYNPKVSADLFSKLTSSFQHSELFLAVGILAVCSIPLLSFDRYYTAERRRAFGIALAGMVVFYAIFVLVLPFAHSFSPGGTRPGLLMSLPAWMMASLALGRAHAIFGEPIARVLIALGAALVTRQYLDVKLDPPFTYSAARVLDQNLLRYGFSPKHSLLLCKVDPAARIGPDVHEVYLQPVLLHLRFMGWKIQTIDCKYGESDWSRVTDSGSSPILKIFKVNGVTPEYRDQILRSCKYHSELTERDAVFAYMCF